MSAGADGVTTDLTDINGGWILLTGLTDIPNAGDFLVWGMRQVKPAKDYIPTTGYSDHSLHDAKSLAMHTVIAYKISQDPGLLEKARENLADMRSRHEPDDMPLYVERVETDPGTALGKQIAALLIAVTEEAIRLRHCSPFAGNSDRRRTAENH